VIQDGLFAKGRPALGWRIRYLQECVVPLERDEVRACHA
jgi:hypothetical protein